MELSSSLTGESPMKLRRFFILGCSTIDPKGWADPPLVPESELQSRMSHMGRFPIENGLPLNPHGRTGLRGRGLLGNWGPNHAADPIVTRLHPVDKYLEMVCFQGLFCCTLTS